MQVIAGVGILSNMGASRFPLQYLIAALALWLNRQQQEVIDYLKEENRLLKEKLGDRKLHFTDAERRRLGPVGTKLQYEDI